MWCVYTVLSTSSVRPLKKYLEIRNHVIWTAQGEQAVSCHVSCVGASRFCMWCREHELLWVFLAKAGSRTGDKQTRGTLGPSHCPSATSCGATAYTHTAQQPHHVVHVHYMMWPTKYYKMHNNWDSDTQCIIRSNREWSECNQDAIRFLEESILNFSSTTNSRGLILLWFLFVVTRKLVCFAIENLL